MLRLLLRMLVLLVCRGRVNLVLRVRLGKKGDLIILGGSYRILLLVLVDLCLMLLVRVGTEMGMGIGIGEKAL